MACLRLKAWPGGTTALPDDEPAILRGLWFLVARVWHVWDRYHRKGPTDPLVQRLNLQRLSSAGAGKVAYDSPEKMFGHLKRKYVDQIYPYWKNVGDVPHPARDGDELTFDGARLNARQLCERLPAAASSSPKRRRLA